MVDKLTTQDLTDFLTGEGRQTKFCFIVGSGCLVENGIPTGWEMVSMWYRELPSVYSSKETRNGGFERTLRG
jgi:hypothetical protein